MSEGFAKSIVKEKGTSLSVVLNTRSEVSQRLEKWLSS